MSLYIDFFHGYSHTDDVLDDWGFKGPILGPFKKINIDSIFNIFEGLTIKIVALSKEINIPVCNYYGAIPIIGSYFCLTDIINEKQFNKEKEDRIEKTQKVLSTPYDKINILLNDSDEWVRNFARFVLTDSKVHSNGK